MSTFSGTVLGFAGGLITQLVPERQKQASEKRKRVEDNLVELVKALYEHNHWIVVLASIELFNSDELESKSGFGKIASVTRVHFPNLRTLLLS